ncbi:App1 family protein [Maribellus mangrovi]|uniref:App1 family protein n=1 Tax=Maribellus mangrovi TaxID=3133146 RepID=UPI0030ED9360
MENQICNNDYFERKRKGPLKRQKVWLKHRLGWLGIPRLVPYRGFGSYFTNKAYINGMLTEDKGLEKPDEKQSILENFLSMVKRYSGDQIPDARVSVEFMDSRQELSTKANGLLSTSFPIPEENSDAPTQWLNYRISLLDQFDQEGKTYDAFGEILIPGTDAEFGVISDIDDTIMVSHSTKTLRKLRLLLTHNSRTRKPFPGVEAFYRALHTGMSGTASNPFFYISSSEWNLYDLIDDFCTYNNFPKGVFLLREIIPGFLNLWKQGGRNHEHKFEKIMQIFESYPYMDFVLVGDNGQHDPNIYSRIAHRFPGRVKAIYIRTISKRKNRQMQKFISEMQKINVQMVFTPDTINAAQHAFNNKLIAQSAVGKVISSSMKN